MKKFFPLCLILILAFSWSFASADKIDSPVYNLSNVGGPVAEKAEIVVPDETVLFATPPEDMSERGANKNMSPQLRVLRTRKPRS